MGLAAVGSVLSVLYLANVHLVFASGRSEGLALVTPVALLAWGGLAHGGPVRRSGLTAVAGGMAVTYAAMAVGVAVLARRVSPTRWHESRLAAPLAVGVGLCLVGAALPVGGAWPRPAGRRGRGRRAWRASRCGASSPADTAPGPRRQSARTPPR